MARLPMPMIVDDLRFTGNMRVEFTVKWASDDPFAAMIDHIRVRFLMTNLLDVGVDDDAVLAEMEGWDDLTPLTAGTENVPNTWDANLVMLHRLDYRSPVLADGATDNDATTELIHEVPYAVPNAAFQQRFVRLIAQARTAD